jgi:hypothetical protein
MTNTKQKAREHCNICSDFHTTEKHTDESEEIYRIFCECGKVKDISDYIEFIKGNARHQALQEVQEIINKVDTYMFDGNDWTKEKDCNFISKNQINYEIEKLRNGK